MKNVTTERVLALRLAPLACLVLAASARAQLVFSIDYKGPTHTNGATAPLRESDVLVPAGGMPAPGPLPLAQVFLPSQQFGVGTVTACTSPQNGVPCGLEVDALSFGNDKTFNTSPDPTQRARLFFSVDWAAQGVPIVGPPPNLFTEHLASESASDVYTTPPLPNLPLPPGGVPVPRNVLVIDGDGEGTSAGGVTYRGLGLVEPHGAPSSVFPFANVGDDLDALYIFPTGTSPQRVYFSLDTNHVDPLTGIPGSGSAAAQGRFPGTVYFAQVGTTNVLEYASAQTLGLDRAGPATDDLDVLILHENGVAGYQKSLAPYDWNGATPTDMLVFSVRRGSAVIGTTDFLLGLPIEEGDLLVPPPLGIASMPPGILIAAENLGLFTRRMHAGFEGDELDGGATGEICYDCNGNGIEDAVDISTGSSADVNHNGVPDECESTYSIACTCPASAPPPCSNDDATAGCKNSTGVGGKLTPSGTASVGTDDLVITATQLPPPATGIWLRAATDMPPMGLKDGLFCLGSRFFRMGMSGPGVATKGPGIVAQASTTIAPINPGSTWHFQYYYRNVSGPCHLGANLTNMVSVTFAP